LILRTATLSSPDYCDGNFEITALRQGSIIPRVESLITFYEEMISVANYCQTPVNYFSDFSLCVGF